MNNLQSNTSGLDCVIKQFQTDLYNALDTLYAFDIEGYPRVYRNPNNDDDIVPEVWVEAKSDYQELLLDDSRPYSFFFIDGEEHKTEDGSYFTAPLKIVFLVDVSRLNATVRADAQAQNEAVHSIKRFTHEDFQITSIEKGIKNVFRGFNTDKIQFDDMQPWHVFSVGGTIGYYLNKNCQ